MLAADKLQLQSAFRQQATALKEKEFNLHHSNMMTVGTQAAVLAGLDITMFIEFNPPGNSEWGDEWIIMPRCLKFFYYCTILSAFCANMIVVSQTTTLSVLGAGLALRGPDGSMLTATDGLYEERGSVFKAFGFGMACTVGSVVLSVWLILHWEAALCCSLLTIFTGRTIWVNYQRVQKKFTYDESETVDFSDIMNGPISIPFSRKKGVFSRGNPRNTTNSNTRDIRRGFSAPLEIDDGGEDSDDWQQQSQRFLRDQDIVKRRQRSPNHDVQIQTI
ncbi:hypothetical protein IV203_016072 [Nitzschia inconspicua]|uniref:Uncharacterized protein n=1 Tax=Nitzschia inconspicua TaxID=303405 RepID=A0A9K3PH11_9STRA|nr:hypothetical protein IV203_016072 [Nitzschia inconspicua]